MTIEDAVMAVSVMECSMQVRRQQNEPLYYTTNDNQSNCILDFFVILVFELLVSHMTVSVNSMCKEN